MDHIFQQAHFSDDPATYGPPLYIREHSFLENPALPGSALVSTLPLPSASPSIESLAALNHVPPKPQQIEI